MENITVFILVALIWGRPPMQDPDSGVIQIEFDTKEKCERAQTEIVKKFFVTQMECMEIKK